MAGAKKQRKGMDWGPCAICGRLACAASGGGAVRMKNGEPLCGACVRRIRFLYPMTRERKKGMVSPVDPLTELTTEEVRTVIAQAADRLEDLREQYAPHHAVFRIDSWSEEKQGVFKPPKNHFYGYVLYGRFNNGEQVRLLCGSGAEELTLCEVQGDFFGGGDGEAGYPCALCAEGKGIGARPGDLIVKD